MSVTLEVLKPVRSSESSLQQPKNIPDMFVTLLVFRKLSPFIDVSLSMP